MLRITSANTGQFQNLEQSVRWPANTRHQIQIFYKKAELTPGLARDRNATWRLIMNWDSQQRLKV